jgi:hypothetical protein
MKSGWIPNENFGGIQATFFVVGLLLAGKPNRTDFLFPLI